MVLHYILEKNNKTVSVVSDGYGGYTVEGFVDGKSTRKQFFNAADFDYAFSVGKDWLAELTEKDF